MENKVKAAITEYIEKVFPCRTKEGGSCDNWGICDNCAESELIQAGAEIACKQLEPAHESANAEYIEMTQYASELRTENKKLSDDNDKLKQLFSVQLDVMEQNKNLESKLLEAVKIINEMQGAIKYGWDNGREAFNIGAKFNYDNPDLFNKYLKSKGIL